MPLYDFRCDTGHRFEQHVPITGDAAPACPTCGVSSTKLPSAGALLGRASAGLSLDRMPQTWRGTYNGDPDYIAGLRTAVVRAAAAGGRSTRRSPVTSGRSSRTKDASTTPRYALGTSTSADRQAATGTPTVTATRTVSRRSRRPRARDARARPAGGGACRRLHPGAVRPFQHDDAGRSGRRCREDRGTRSRRRLPALGSAVRRGRRRVLHGGEPQQAQCRTRREECRRSASGAGPRLPRRRRGRELAPGHGGAARAGPGHPAHRQPRSRDRLDQRLRPGRRRPCGLRPDRAGHLRRDVADRTARSPGEVGRAGRRPRCRDVRRHRHRRCALRTSDLGPRSRPRHRHAGQPGRDAHPPRGEVPRHR